MSVGAVQSMLRRCPALALLLPALACTRPASDSCAGGPECAAELEPPAALVNMPAAAAPASGCGDGVRDPEREECDDGSACRDGRDCTEEPARCQVGGGDRSCAPRAGDGCSAACRVEPGYSCSDQGVCQPLGAPPASSEGLPEPQPSPAGAPSESSGSAPLAAAGAGSTAEPPGSTPQPAGNTAEPGNTTQPPASPPACDPARFEPPERVSGLEPGLAAILFGAPELWAPSLSSDGGTLFFAAAQPGATERIFSATRSQRGRRFDDPAPQPGLDSGAGDGTPVLSHDGLRLYFYSRRPGGTGDRDLWQATRADLGADFASATVLPAVNSAALDHLPWLSPDERTLLFVSNRPGGVGQSDLWLARREGLDAEFARPALLPGINSSADEGRGVLSSSGTVLIFASDRAGGQGRHDLWLATRANEAADFGPARPLSELNGPSVELDPFLALDDRELFFVSDRAGGPELWRAQSQCDD